VLVIECDDALPCEQPPPLGHHPAGLPRAGRVSLAIWDGRDVARRQDDFEDGPAGTDEQRGSSSCGCSARESKSRPGHRPEHRSDKNGEVQPSNPVQDRREVNAEVPRESTDSDRDDDGYGNERRGDERPSGKRSAHGESDDGTARGHDQQAPRPIDRWENEHEREEGDAEERGKDPGHHGESVAYRLARATKREQTMEIGLYGLGRMGSNMVTRLARGKHRVVAGNRSPEPVQEAIGHGAVGAKSIQDLVGQLKPPRVLWSMVPAGDVTDHTLDEFTRYASKGDVLVDGGNSNFRDSMARAARYGARGFRFLDVGVSGGIWGLDNGFCMMVGGPADAVAIAKPALDTLAPPNGWAHFGKNGAGHFVKMVHNGIEYGMMQAYGEGFELLHASEFALDLRMVSQVWLQGSVVRSWLLELAERAFAQEGSDLAEIKGWVEDSGEGRWTVLEAVNHGVPMTAISHSLFARFVSRQEDSYAMKVAAALRNQFGGHAVKKED